MTTIDEDIAFIIHCRIIELTDQFISKANSVGWTIQSLHSIKKPSASQLATTLHQMAMTIVEAGLSGFESDQMEQDAKRAALAFLALSEHIRDGLGDLNVIRADVEVIGSAHNEPSGSTQQE